MFRIFSHRILPGRLTINALTTAAEQDLRGRSFMSNWPKTARRSLKWTVGLVAILAHKDVVHAQPTFHVADVVACATCALDARLVTTLRAPADSSFYVHFASTLSRNAKGQFLLAPLDNLGTFAMFDSTGKFLRTVGRKGPGPAEYKFIERAQIGDADTIVVLDAMQHRVSILSPSGAFIIGIPVQGYVRDIAPVRGGRFVINGTIGTSVSVGEPLHIINSLGTVVTSFGSNGRAMRAGRTIDLLRKIVVGGSSLWSIPTNEYLLEEWSFAGKKLQSVVRDAPWFQRYDTPLPGKFNERRPDPYVRGIQIDAGGLLYVFTSVADMNWRAARPPTRPPSGPPGDSTRVGGEAPGEFSVVQQERFYDTVVEIIDPLRRELVFSKRFDHTILPMNHAGWGYRYRDDQTLPVLEVYRLSFHNPAKEAR